MELRLWDDKRRQIQIGDEVEFANAQNNNDTFVAKVINLHLASNFAKLCGVIDCRVAGFATAEELINCLNEIYGAEEQNKYGVVGIEIQRI